MTGAVKKVLEAATALSEEERAEVAARLEQSLGAFATPENAAAWEEEITERIRAIDAGEVELIPAEEVHRRLQEKYGFFKSYHPRRRKNLRKHFDGTETKTSQLLNASARHISGS